MITISSDGYVRLTIEDLKKMLITHLVSDLDDNILEFLKEDTGFSQITGYTEWVSTGVPTISMGWDWIIKFSGAEGKCCKRVGGQRSNIILINEEGCDLGFSMTNSIIENFIDNMNWKNKVVCQIKSKIQLKSH